MDRPLTPSDASALIAAAKAPTMSAALDRARALLRESDRQTQTRRDERRDITRGV